MTQRAARCKTTQETWPGGTQPRIFVSVSLDCCLPFPTEVVSPSASPAMLLPPPLFPAASEPLLQAFVNWQTCLENSTLRSQHMETVLRKRLPLLQQRGKGQLRSLALARLYHAASNVVPGTAHRLQAALGLYRLEPKLGESREAGARCRLQGYV